MDIGLSRSRPQGPQVTARLPEDSVETLAGWGGPSLELWRLRSLGPSCSSPMGRSLPQAGRWPEAGSRVPSAGPAAVGGRARSGVNAIITGAS